MGLFDRLRADPSPEKFASLFIRALRSAGVAEDLLYDKAENRIMWSRGGQPAGVTNLGNMYAVYVGKARAERADYLRAAVRTATVSKKELPADFDSAVPDIRAKIWTRSMFEHQRLRDGPSPGQDAIASVPVGEHLLASVAYDWPESVQSINRSNLEAWGVTIYEALEVARENLRDTMLGFSKIGDSLVSAMTGDSYDASRLLLTDWVADLGMAGRPVAMVPNRDTLLITGEDDETGLRMMLGLAEEALGEPYPLIGGALVLEAGEWVDWLPPGGHPSHRPFRRLRLDWIGPEYTEQKRLLEEVHGRTGEDLFVASFSAAATEGGDRLSYCVWGEGVDSLLPETDLVFLMKRGVEGPAASGTWDRVVDVAGDLMEPTGHYPARYRVRAFPDESQLARIGVAEL